MVITTKLDRTRKFDPITEEIIRTARKTIADKEDDFILFITGTTGTGKSMLSLHIYEFFDPDGCSVEAIGLNKNSHAKALKFASKKPSKRMCIYDEANISRRDHATKYNKDLLELYFQIRGMQIFHIWSNPSVNILDKPFIEERLKGLIFINSKSSPRNFYYFTKKSLLKIYHSTGGVLNHRALDKYKDLAYYKGWFFDYDGKLRGEYDREKTSKMSSAIDQFAGKYSDSEDEGDEVLIKPRDFANKHLIDIKTAYAGAKKLQSEGNWFEGVDYHVSLTGRIFYTVSGANKLVDHIKGTNCCATISGFKK